MKRTWLVLIIFTLILLGLLSCGAGKEKKNQVAAEIATLENIKTTLDYLAKNLDQATFTPVREGWQFDYGFTDGWLLNKYEYVRSLVTYKRFQAMLDYPIYLSGPHTGDTLNLDAKYSFGHYNPKFVTQLHKSALILMNEEAFVANTKPLLQQYGILDFLRKHKHIHEITQEYPDEFESITSNFKSGIKDESWPEGGYRSMVPSVLDTYAYWNWSETSYHFWVRRDVDGTKDLWLGLITDVLNAYGN
ncbi:hypothetical protein FGM00_11855 [Aggregatimonas sangjinii]|uniref:Uncharacterized protein n=1 Tax=Aggregatimonas sangjinii TaxID=2583587 RepID=A0A5B7SQE1_9FLAO|nr:hypothetical protein [Aggregatimonas sangjinii]QCX00767.1 hypothetical protein FGM00_11855 [Aggregatimonas sangjinii]